MPEVQVRAADQERGWVRSLADRGQQVLERQLVGTIEMVHAIEDHHRIAVIVGDGQLQGDETLCVIARELIETVRGSVTIDWTLRENVRADLRRLVKRILRRYGYPPDKQEKATQTVLEQAEVLSKDWIL